MYLWGRCNFFSKLDVEIKWCKSQVYIETLENSKSF